MDGKSQQAAVNEPMIQPNRSTDQPQSKEQVTVGEQNLSSDYTDATLETWNKIPLHLRIHVLVAYVTCTILFFGTHFYKYQTNHSKNKIFSHVFISNLLKKSFVTVWHWSGSTVWWYEMRIY